jgi:endonuclease/exonuclease/phosphatase family metal-dependent hydrolase
MPFYQAIDGTTREGKRTIDGCLRLREALQKLPVKTINRTLLLASWNLRQFGGSGKNARDDESLFYLAQIIAKFDLVAVQEVKTDLRCLDELMRKLGGWWKYLVSDVCAGKAGNAERMAFIYDSRKLVFGGLAGELETPGKLVGKPGKSGASQRIAGTSRSPYVAGFRAGWFKFTICTMHGYYGDASPKNKQRGVDALETARRLRERMKQKDRWAVNSILLGDFNIFSEDDPAAKNLVKEGFSCPHGLRGVATNAKGTQPFDRLLFIAPDVKRQLEAAQTGVFKVFDHVYRDEEHKDYGMSLKAFQNWRTYKISDHYPMWCEINIDFADKFLQSRRGKKPEDKRNS